MIIGDWLTFMVTRNAVRRVRYHADGVVYFRTSAVLIEKMGLAGDIRGEMCRGSQQMRWLVKFLAWRRKIAPESPLSCIDPPKTLFDSAAHTIYQANRIS
jgi:hypothetical protein